jgi:hypothetical protein
MKRIDWLVLLTYLVIAFIAGMILIKSIMALIHLHK